MTTTGPIAAALGSGARPLPEPTRRRAIRAELIDSSTDAREAEWLEGFGDHGVKHRRGGDAGGDVGAEVLPRVRRHEGGDVIDQGLIQRRIAMAGAESG